MSDAPQTIDTILSKYWDKRLSAHELDEIKSVNAEAKAQLKAIIEAEIAAIIGEDEPYLRGRAFAASPRYAKNMAIRVENELKQVQRQRAAEAMERMFGKEAA